MNITVINGSPKGKYSCQLSKSKHFFDMTAAKYILAVSDDLGMPYISCHSADTEDLSSDTGHLMRQYENIINDISL